MYSDSLLDHFQSPRNVGDMQAPDAEASASNPVCGDQLRIQFRIVDDVIAQVLWRADGCPPSLAAASAASELLTGMRVEEARALEYDAIDRAVGGLPPRKGHAAHLVLQAIRQALPDEP